MSPVLRRLLAWLSKVRPARNIDIWFRAVWGASHWRLDLLEAKDRAIVLHDVTALIEQASNQLETGDPAQ